MKGFLSEQGVSYREREISQDEAAIQELEALGVMTTPVVRVGEEIVIGFDRARLAALLEMRLPSALSEAAKGGQDEH